MSALKIVDDRGSLSDGDLAIENNRWVLLTGTDAVRQRIRTRLRTFLGEWFLNLGLGVPYFQEILRKGPSLAAIESTIQDTIEGTPGVARVTDIFLTVDSTARQLTVTYTAQLTGGDTITEKGFPLAA